MLLKCMNPIDKSALHRLVVGAAAEPHNACMGTRSTTRVLSTAVCKAYSDSRFGFRMKLC